MEDLLELVWLIPLLPLVGFVLLVAFGRKLGEPWAGWLATVLVAGSFVATIVVFIGLLDRPEEARHFELVLFEWLPAGGLTVEAGFLVDPLSITMALFVTGISALIHLYSIGYMHGDADFPKFFTYLNLFVFSMLILVLGNNFLLTFVGWEGVGTCSYLLISFWFTDSANASAGKKAFVTNRIGDFGFMLATFLIFGAVGTLQYEAVFAATPTIAPGDGDGHRPPAVPRRMRQVGAAPAVRLAARCHGRPHAGLGAHPCRHDGDRGRLPHDQGQPAAGPGL